MTEPRRWRFGKLRHAALAVPLFLLAACSDDRQSALDPEGPFARKVDRLWDWGFWTAVVVFVVVELLIVIALVRFRERTGDERPRQVHGNTPLEIGWTIVPALILAVLAVPTVATVFDLADQPDGDNVLQVEVIGHQWWWEYRYPDHDIVTANELHIPTNVPVNVKLISDDVIHSFWVPKLAGKLDVQPSQPNYLTLQADHPGVYSGQCAEYCGLSHANMRVRVVAQDPEDFEQWLKDQRAPAQRPSAGLAAEGFRLFGADGGLEQPCIACHTIKGRDDATGQVGPDLTHLASRETFGGVTFELTADNLKRWLADPPDMKPMLPEDVGPKGKPMGMPDLNLSDDEIEALVAYLQTLR